MKEQPATNDYSMLQVSRTLMRKKSMSSKLYKLALWYIKKCNSKCTIQYKEKVESLPKLTYKTHDKYMLLYGNDAEWRILNKYDVLDNAIQRLAAYENIRTVEELKTLNKM